MVIDFSQSNNIQKVLEKLRKYDKREIQIKNIQNLPHNKTALGGVDDSGKDIIIYLNYDMPFEIQEETCVHEILHIILEHEGYPTISIKRKYYNNLSENSKKLVRRAIGQFIDSIQHPIIFNREINDYHLDVDKCFSQQVIQKVNRFKKRKTNVKKQHFYFLNQQDILVSMEYFYYPKKYSDSVLEKYSVFSPDAYRSSKKLFKKIENVGFINPISCYRSASIIKKHIIKYGKRKGLIKYNYIWENIEIQKGTPTQ